MLGPETHVASRGQTTAKAAASVQHFCLDLDEAPAARGSRPALGGQAAGAGPAAHRGPVRRRTVARCPFAADGGTAGGRFCAGFPRGGGREGPGCGVSGAGPYCHLPRLRGAAAGVRGTHVLRQKGRGRKKKKKRRKRRLPRSPRPRLVSGCCLRSTRARPRLLRTAWFYSGYMFLPRSRRLFGTNSTLFLCEGGACAVRTWKPGLSTHPRLVPLEPLRSTRNLNFWETTHVFRRAFVYESHLFGVRLWRTGLPPFLAECPFLVRGTNN